MTRILVGLAMCAALAVTLSGQQAPQRPPVFRAAVDKVRIDALVTHQGKPVQGLMPADFELKDNGVLQTVDISTTADSVAVAVVLDLSGSVMGDALDDLRAATLALVDALEPGDEAWLVTFAESFNLKVGPTTDRDAVRRALGTIRPGGGTSMWDAVYSSVALVTGMAGRSLVIAMTDGIDTTSWMDEKRAVDALKRAEVVVTAVRPQDSNPEGRGLIGLESLATTTGGKTLLAHKNTKIGQQFVELLREFRLGYVLTYSCTAKPREDGWHKVEVKLKDKKGTVRARTGYFEAGR